MSQASRTKRVAVRRKQKVAMSPSPNHDSRGGAVPIDESMASDENEDNATIVSKPSITSPDISERSPQESKKESQSDLRNQTKPGHGSLDAKELRRPCDSDASGRLHVWH